MHWQLPRTLSCVTALLAGMIAHGILAETAQGSSIETIIDRSNGEVFLKNPSAAVVAIDGYSIFSPGASLLPGAWSSVTNLYDLSGNGTVDASTDWFVISSATNSLAEVSPNVFSGSLGSGQFVSLGLIWQTGDAESLAATVSDGATTTDMIGDFRTLTADYDEDLDVDTDDYDLFVATFGSVVDLRADGNGNGVIDAADYTVWRDSEELILVPLLSTVALPANGSQANGPRINEPVAIPEPTGAVLLFAGWASVVIRRRH